MHQIGPPSQGSSGLVQSRSFLKASAGMQQDEVVWRPDGGGPVKNEVTGGAEWLFLVWSKEQRGRGQSERREPAWAPEELGTSRTGRLRGHLLDTQGPGTLGEGSPGNLGWPCCSQTPLQESPLSCTGASGPRALLS